MLVETVELGVSGIQLKSGDHVCAFYRSTEERDALLVPYMLEGLKAGHKCICVTDSTSPARMLATLNAAADLNVEDCVSLAQLNLLSSGETYLDGGSFCSERMLESLRDRVGFSLTNEGFHLVRLAGEMSWAARDIQGVEQLLTYEGALKDFYRRYPAVGICFYDVELFRGEIVLDVLKIHPKVLVGGMLVENPYLINAEELLAGRPSRT
jgi:hypothetical protein